MYGLDPTSDICWQGIGDDLIIGVAFLPGDPIMFVWSRVCKSVG